MERKHESFGVGVVVVATRFEAAVSSAFEIETDRQSDSVNEETNEERTKLKQRRQPLVVWLCAPPSASLYI